MTRAQCLLSLLVGTIFIAFTSTHGLKCYDTCFEDCNSAACAGKCGAVSDLLPGESVALPGIIQVECSGDGNLCVMQEVFANPDPTVSPKDIIAISVPKGCAFTSKLNNSDVFNFWIRGSDPGTVYLCNSDLCNDQNLASCGANAQECPAQQSDVTTKSLLANRIRALGRVSTRTERCIVNAFTPITPSLSCLKSTEPCTEGDLLSSAADSVFVDCDKMKLFNRNEVIHSRADIARVLEDLNATDDLNATEAPTSTTSQETNVRDIIVGVVIVLVGLCCCCGCIFGILYYVAYYVNTDNVVQLSYVRNEDAEIEERDFHATKLVVGRAQQMLTEFEAYTSDNVVSVDEKIRSDEEAELVALVDPHRGVDVSRFEQI